MKKHVLVTGATGFVGRAVCHRLQTEATPMLAAVRTTVGERIPRAITVGDIGPDTDWRAALAGCGVVLHLAARVHVMQDTAADPLEAFRRVNLSGTLALARQAIEAGVSRFVYVSSVKVNGEETAPDKPFTAADVPAPLDPYGISKHEAETALRELCAVAGMELVIVRPPLVYGPGVKANFAAMMRWVARGMPLPLACVRHNRRSLVGLDNLVDLLVTCLSHPAAAGRVFMVCDGEDLSTACLLQRMGQAMGRPARLLPVPVFMLRLGALLMGRPAIAQRLCGSLQIDMRETCRALDWQPPIGVDEALRRAAAANPHR